MKQHPLSPKNNENVNNEFWVGVNRYFSPMLEFEIEKGVFLKNIRQVIGNITVV